MKDLFRNIIQKNVRPDIYAWLTEKAGSSSLPGNNYQLNLTFTSIPRKTGKQEISLEDTDKTEVKSKLAGFSPEHWTIDRLSRVWLLMQLDTSDKEEYVKRIENLFPQAEMNEQVALYSSLPLLAYPDHWTGQCAVGIRSNIDDVLKAIMYHNPYPATYLEDAAWNQMIMKAFFTGKNVHKITGIDDRKNPELADMLLDYVAERWSAHRSEDPQIWRLTGKYLKEEHLTMIERLFKKENEKERQAAALACAASSSEKAKQLLDQHPQYKKAIEANTLTWAVVAGDKE